MLFPGGKPGATRRPPHAEDHGFFRLAGRTVVSDVVWGAETDTGVVAPRAGDSTHSQLVKRLPVADQDFGYGQRNFCTMIFFDLVNVTKSSNAFLFPV